MGDEVRVEIECRICDEKGPRPDSYIPAQLIAYNNMNEVCTGVCVCLCVCVCVFMHM